MVRQNTSIRSITWPPEREIPWDSTAHAQDHCIACITSKITSWKIVVGISLDLIFQFLPSLCQALGQRPSSSRFRPLTRRAWRAPESAWCNGHKNKKLQEQEIIEHYVLKTEACGKLTRASRGLLSFGVTQKPKYETNTLNTPAAMINLDDAA